MYVRLFGSTNPRTSAITAPLTVQTLPLTSFLFSGPLGFRFEVLGYRFSSGSSKVAYSHHDGDGACYYEDRLPECVIEDCESDEGKYYTCRDLCEA